jgi:NAD(P)-dependent dehydrogenase (short-subunit alcohol dehydrogenase family)
MPATRSEVVVITGASAGVGRATAQAFARQGAKIALLARGRAGLAGARAEVERLGGQALEIPTDVAEAEAVEEAAARTEAEFGPIDIWINNAMCSVFSPVKEMTPQEYKRVTEVTYLGYVYGTLAALKRMLPRDRGMIVQVGSALAYRGIPLQSAYCAAKHAIQGFNDSLRSELLHDGSQVKLTMVQMPALNTPQFQWVKSRLPRKPQPVPPIYQPEVAAEAIYWAAHHDRREWFVGGSTAVAIEGNKLLPGVGDWYLSQQGYDSQQTEGKVSPERRDNLFWPVDDVHDHGAHGEFDDRATPSSLFTQVDRHREYLALAGTLAALATRGGLTAKCLGAAAAIGLGILGLAAVAKRSPCAPTGAERADRPSNHQGVSIMPTIC